MRRRCLLLSCCLLFVALSLLAGCGGGGGNSGNAHSSTPAPTVNLSLSPESIQSGQSATLTWATSHATSVQITETPQVLPPGNEAMRTTSVRVVGTTPKGPVFRHEEGGAVKVTATSEPRNGSMTVSPSVTTTYTLTATGPGGTVQAQATLTVTAATSSEPTATISVSPQTIAAGQNATLTWSTTNATSAVLGNQQVALNGSMPVSPTSTTTYTLVATGAGGTAQAQVVLTVTSTPQPTASISVSPQSITGGQSATLSWSTTNATSAMLGDQQVALNGSMSVSPTSTTTYTLVATGAGGTAQAEITLTVTSPPPQMSADDLVKTYNIDPIPNSNPATMGKTMRWPNGTVSVYDETGFNGLQSALSVWNTAIGGPGVLAQSSDPSSPITISLDSTLASVCGDASYGIHTGTGGDNSIYQCIIRINSTCGLVIPIYAHEIGHCIGFFAHTQDGGLMDANTGNGQISTEDTTMIHHLYELPVGTYIP